MNKDIVYEGDPTRTVLEVEKEEEIITNQSMSTKSFNNALMANLNAKKEFEKWVDRPSIVDYEELKQGTQKIYQPNSVVHHLKAHKQMVHIISSPQVAKFVFYEETLKDRKQVVEVATKYK